MCEGKVLMDMLFSFRNKYHYTYLNTSMSPPSYPTFMCRNWNDWYWVWEARAPPSGKGVTGEGSLANEGTSLRGMDNNLLFL